MRATRIVSATARRTTLPLTMVRAALRAPRTAADHPSSRELRRLLDAGFTVTGYRRGRGTGPVEVTLERDGETAVVASTDLAFAAYAASAVPRAVARERATGALVSRR